MVTMEQTSHITNVISTKSSFRESVANVTFCLMLLKFFDLGMWPHAYLGEAVESSIFSQIIVTIWVLCSIFNLFINSDSFFRSLSQNKIIFLFLFYCLLNSLFISIYPFTSLQFTLYYFMSAITAFIFVDKSCDKSIKNSLFNITLIYLTLNMFSMLYPDTAYMKGFHNGLFRGFTAHKNDMGQHLLFLLLAVISADTKKPIWRLALFFLISYFMFISYSAQTIIMSSMILLILFLIEIRKYVDQVIFLVTIIFSSIFLMISIFLDAQGIIFGALGKDENFSGRDIIWSFFAEKIVDFKYFGYGLGAFFQDPGLRSQLVSYGIWWPITTTHSAYLESIVALGYVGGLLFALVLLSVVLRVLRSQKTSSILQTVGGLLVAASLVGGITASEKLFKADFGWMSFVFGVALVNKYYFVNRVHQNQIEEVS